MTTKQTTRKIKNPPQKGTIKKSVVKNVSVVELLSVESLLSGKKKFMAFLTEKPKFSAIGETYNESLNLLKDKCNTATHGENKWVYNESYMIGNKTGEII